MAVVKALLYGLISLVACAAIPQQAGPAILSTEAALGQMIAHGGIVLSLEAKLQSDSAWRVTRETETEQAMCVPRGAYAFGVALNGRPFVIVLGFVAANIDSANAVNVWWSGSICGDSLPSWHSHWKENGMRWQASPCDRHQAAVRPRVPFHLVASDTGKVSAYMPDQNFASTAVNWCGR